MTTTNTTAGWVGELIGQRYKVTAKLGEGGMGFVYRALDQDTGHDMVIKVPRLEALRSPDFAGRFEREIRALLTLDHVHIVKVRNLGRHQTTPFAVMDFLAGGSLREQQFDDIGQAIVMPLGAIANWLEPIADALDFIHDQGYIHRDVKPDNILFDLQGHPFLGDFGVAKLVREDAMPGSPQIKTREGRLMGTPEYMAPELLLGHKYDGQIDQYALGVTLFEMLTGQIPFMDVTETAMMLRQVTEPPPDLCTLRPSIPAAVAAAVARALSKKPADRYPTCQAFSQTVLAALKGEPQQEPLDSDPGAPSKSVKPMRAISCPACDKRFAVYVHGLGRLIRCLQCGKRFQTRKSDGEALDPALAEALVNKRRAKHQQKTGVAPEAKPTPRAGGKEPSSAKPTMFDPFATETEASLRAKREATPHPFATTGEETPIPPIESFKPRPPAKETTPVPRPKATAPFTPLEAGVLADNVTLTALQPPTLPKDDATIQLKAGAPSPNAEPPSAFKAHPLPPLRPEEDATIQLKAAAAPVPAARKASPVFLGVLAASMILIIALIWILVRY